MACVLITHASLNNASAANNNKLIELKSEPPSTASAMASKMIYKIEANPPDLVSISPKASPQSLIDVTRQYQAENKQSIYFPRRSATLTKEGLDAIALHAKNIKDNPSLYVTLVGYADYLGSSSYSLALAEQRTKAVAETLADLGVQQRQIRSATYGHEKAGTLPCTSEICAISYRRVEFQYVKPDKWSIRRPISIGSKKINTDQP